MCMSVHLTVCIPVFALYILVGCVFINTSCAVGSFIVMLSCFFTKYTVLVNSTQIHVYFYILQSVYKESSCQNHQSPPTLFLHLAIAIACWIPALVFFRRPESDWAVSNRCNCYVYDVTFVDLSFIST